MHHPHRSIVRRGLPLIAAAFTVALAGCATRPASPFEPAGGASPSAIRHVVLIDLKDPADADALIARLDSAIAEIPGILNYWRGVPFPSDRPEVKADYDVGLVIDFRDAAAYEAYTTDPHHTSVVADWKPKLVSFRVHDIRSAAQR